MNSLYLIGGSGFIGKNLAQYFVKKYKIIIFDRYIDKVFFASYPSIETVEIDLVKEKIPEKFSNPHFIVNLASIVTADRDMSLFDDLVSSNLNVLLNLYERFSKSEELRLFIQFGSSEEYGVIKSPLKETSREMPLSPYALIKQLTTNTSIMLYQNYKFPIMVVRPGNLFGSLQNKTKFIPYIIEQLKQDKELNVSPCEQKRDFIYIDDFCYIIDMLLLNYSKCKGEIVNISNGYSISLKDIIEYCKKKLNSNSVINYGALRYRENEVMNLECDISKLKNILNMDIEFDTKQRIKELLNKQVQ